MNCKQAQELIAAVVDGAAGARERDSLQRHLAACRRCYAEYAQQVELDRALGEALPLPVSLGEEFAARVVAQASCLSDPRKLEACATAGSLRYGWKLVLRRARLKYALVGAVVLAVAAYLLIPTRSLDSQALAAIQQAMSRVKSVHWIMVTTLPEARAQNPGMECWSTPTASRAVNPGGWQLFTQSRRYRYLRSTKTLFIIPAGLLSPGEMFTGMVDPQSITRVARGRKQRVAIENIQTKLNGKAWRRVTVISDPPKNADREARRMRRLTQMMRKYLPKPRGGRYTRATVVVPRVKAVYLVDPSTNLVRSMGAYIPSRSGDGWREVARTTLIEYNTKPPSGTFYLPKVPAGTKTVDLTKALAVLRWVPAGIVEGG